MKFGKLAPKTHPKTLKFSKYLTNALPLAPEKVYREYKVPPSLWGMLKNDTLGDCTCAAIAHMLMLVTAHTGTMVTPTEEDVVTAYAAVSGYNPQNGSNDNGAAITDVLEYWRTKGIAGHKIEGWAEVNHANIPAIKQAIYLFGGVDIGVQLPNAAMSQVNEGVAWDLVTNDGGIDGGHSIPNFGYGRDGTNCITWGKRQGMSWAWFAKYCDEAYAVITKDWINQASGKTVSGFDLETLVADLNALRA